MLQAASAQVQQALEALTRLAKGLSLSLCIRSRPQIGDLLHRPLRAALQVPLVGALLACICLHRFLTRQGGADGATLTLMLPAGHAVIHCWACLRPVTVWLVDARLRLSRRARLCQGPMARVSSHVQ